TILFASQLLDRMLDGDDTLVDGALGFLIATTVIAVFFSIAGFTPLYGRAMTKIWSLSGAGGKHIIELSWYDWMAAVVRGVAYIALLATIRKCQVGAQAPSPVSTSSRRGRLLPHYWLAALTIVVCAD